MGKRLANVPNQAPGLVHRQRLFHAFGEHCHGSLLIAGNGRRHHAVLAEQADKRWMVRIAFELDLVPGGAGRSSGWYRCASPWR